MKKCSACGASLKDDAKFCPKCGAKQMQEAAGEPTGPQEPVQPGGEARPQEPVPLRQPAQPTGLRQPEPPKKKSVVLFVVICLVLILVMGGGTAFYLWKLNKADSGQEALAAKDRDETEEEEETEEPKSSEESMTETEAAEDAAVSTEAATTPAAAQPATTPAVPQTAPMPTAPPTEPYVPETAALVPADYTTLYVVNCNEFITLRSSASTGASELAKIPLGSAVSYVSTAENGFYKVIYNGRTGYALASYLSSDPSYYAAPETDGYPTMYVVNCDEFITLRTSDSTSASEITKIPLGSAVSYISTAGNGFYKVIYNGNTGYALASYLSY